MLEYDDSAFYYFMIACCTLYLVPATYHIGKTFSWVIFSRRVTVAKARTTLEKVKMDRIATEKSSVKKVFSWFFVINCFVCLGTWIMFVYMFMAVGENKDIATFDPFQILGLSSSAEMKEIKKAYRKMSLQFHPDKNKNNPQAEQMFMKIAKAYEALTDETAAENWKKFGNPDGRQAMEVSIGLPTFLLEEKNHQSILIIYLIVLVVVIPSVVCTWYYKSKQYGDRMVMYDSYHFYRHMLSEHVTLKLMPETLGGSAEYVNKMQYEKSDNEDLSTLYKALKEEGRMQKQKYDKHPQMVKSNLLLHAYLTQIDVPPRLEADLSYIQSKSMHLIEAMIELSSTMRWLQTTKNIIEFSQFMTQGLWLKDSSLLQIPHFTQQEVKHAASGKKPLKTAIQFAKADPETRKGLQKFSDEEIADVEAFLKILPDVDVELIVAVNDEEQIAESDLITLEMVLTRKQVPDKEEVGLVHSPSFPFVKKESWWLLLGDDDSNRLFAIQKCSGQCKVVTEKIQFMAPPRAGTYSFDVYVMNDSYMEVDIHRTIKIEVIPASELPAYEAHPEDLELDNEPTLFEQVMTGNLEDDTESDVDDDSSDDEDSDYEQLTEAQKRKRKDRRRRKKEGDKQEGEEEGDDKKEDKDSDSDDETKKEK